MIVQGSKTQVVDVDIDPVSFLNDLEENWKAIIRVPNSDIKAGYWVSYVPTQMGVIEVRGRLATQHEINVYKAFETVADVARDFE
jgi:hypothetical protein